MQAPQFIVSRVAERENAEVTDLPPFYQVIDPDVLQLFIHSPADASATIEFTYCGYDIVVSGDGTVLVDEQATDSDLLSSV